MQFEIVVSISGDWCSVLLKPSFLHGDIINKLPPLVQIFLMLDSRWSVIIDLMANPSLVRVWWNSLYFYFFFVASFVNRLSLALFFLLFFFGLLGQECVRLAHITTFNEPPNYLYAKTQFFVWHFMYFVCRLIFLRPIICEGGSTQSLDFEEKALYLTVGSVPWGPPACKGRLDSVFRLSGKSPHI